MTNEEIKALILSAALTYLASIYTQDKVMEALNKLYTMSAIEATNMMAPTLFSGFMHSLGPKRVYRWGR